jgi:hypothetical protein
MRSCDPLLWAARVQAGSIALSGQSLLALNSWYAIKYCEPCGAVIPFFNAKVKAYVAAKGVCAGVSCFFNPLGATCVALHFTWGALY